MEKTWLGERQLVECSARKVISFKVLHLAVKFKKRIPFVWKRTTGGEDAVRRQQFGPSVGGGGVGADRHGAVRFGRAGRRGARFAPFPDVAPAAAVGRPRRQGRPAGHHAPAAGTWGDNDSDQKKKKAPSIALVTGVCGTEHTQQGNQDGPHDPVQPLTR